MVNASDKQGYEKRRGYRLCENKPNWRARPATNREPSAPNKANFPRFWPKNEGRAEKQSQLEAVRAGIGFVWGPPCCILCLDSKTGISNLMEIRIESLIEGARRAEGVVVIVDVFRAFTSAAVALARGARKIIMVAEPGDALALRERGVGEVCVGEIDGIRPEGFDFGNSPYEMTRADLEDKVVIQSTRAGTTGVAAAANASAIYAGSFVVARATTEAIGRDAPPLVTIVAMGWNARVRTDEDELCALYLRNLLQGRRPNADALHKLALAGGEVAKFQDPAQPHFHPEDCELALEIDKYDFAIRVHKEEEFLIARRER